MERVGIALSTICVSGVIIIRLLSHHMIAENIDYGAFHQQRVVEQRVWGLEQGFQSLNELWDKIEKQVVESIRNYQEAVSVSYTHLTLPTIYSV